MEYNQAFAYEIKKGGIIIWRCFALDVCAVIPPEIAGYPVRELAPYAFSAHQDDSCLAGKAMTGEIMAPGDQKEIPALCGERLEEILIPDTIERVGRYCFYNCERLEKMEFSGNLKDWGSGAFTGSHKIRHLTVRVRDEGRSTLKEVLQELPEELEVDYYMQKSVDGGEQTEHARLMFPEFFEEGVENTPARILETHVHGSGLYYRNCFRERAFLFGEYDSRFAYARADERPEVLIRMVVGRLRYPCGLSEKARQSYENYLCEERRESGRYILETEEISLLSWFMERLWQENQTLSEAEKREFLDWILEYAGKEGKIPAVSFLMDFGHRHIRKESVFDPFEL